MAEFKKILILDNPVQAHLLDSILTDRGIPHVMISYRDSAYDGIYQLRRGWGHIEAPDEYRNRIVAIYDDLSRSEQKQDNGKE